MTSTTTDRRNEVIESVAERIRSHLEPAEAAASESFARQFLAHVAARDLEEQTPENLYGAALSLWKLGAVRAPSEALVRVYNPRVDEHGWHSRHTVIEIVVEDMRYIFDSATGWLDGHGAEVHLAIHPIVEVERDAQGRLVALHDGVSDDASQLREAFLHIEVTEQPEERHAELTAGLLRVLSDVRAAVEDFAPMRETCSALAGALAPDGEDAAEAEAFLRWLLQDHFNFMGYRLYEFDGERARVKAGSGLGVLRTELASVFDGMLTGGRRPAELDRADLVRFTKTSHRSTVHRPVPMDGIGVKAIGPDGRVIGEHLFIGLFTSRAYGRSPRDIPILRKKVALVRSQVGFAPDSHDARALGHILNTYPRDELYQVSTDVLAEIAIGIVQLQERRRIAVFPRVDPFGRFVSVLVFIPRERYDTPLRMAIQDILASAYDGDVDAFYTRMTDAAHARLHFIVQTTPGAVPEVDARDLEARIAEAGRSWRDRLEAELVGVMDEKDAARALHCFGAAFPSSYRDAFTAAVAVSDIEHIREALAAGDVALNLYRPIEAGEDEVQFKVYTVGQETPLSTVLPMLENMGFRVLREVPYAIRPAEIGATVWIRDFALATKDGSAIDVAGERDRFHEAFRGVWSRVYENDGFNQLVLRAHLTAHEVAILRTICRFLLQARIPFSQHYMEETLARNPETVQLLVEHFRVRFDTEYPADRADAAAGISARIEEGLESVPNLDEDRILRAFKTVLDAMVRTTYYKTDDAGRPLPYLAFKLDSRRIDALPQPRPLYEIFVCSPRMEGCHLRGGHVARGGIRWSDRREDFRTEILSLMKAQMVKNSVIVPVGSKGGFVLKHPPAGREELREEVVACYRTLMSALLDLTDNIVGADIVPPRDVVRHDGDDPYLVVAADKGTATFSDIANDMSGRYGFWLDDAFASGGSAGYDHKGMGITARGAWESVKRHFREVEKDIQQEDFTCVGVGDMSGDVFGNGMLLSRHTLLLGAFNHMHIFVDPDPDPAASFDERRRLFDLQGSTWDDYDRARISEGGGVWPRSLKRIPVSEAMRRRFGLQGAQVAPQELIRALLRANVELLWLGGIGTYVRASHEVDSEVGDRANDALRIDATQLRARVIGEGANLGLTQRARIEYALLGGRCYTDAIDNSAGVDCSDHEVNIKILLGEAERDGDITRKQRNELLESMTDDVGDLVLRDNYLQTLSLSVTHHLGAHLLDRLARLMRGLSRQGRLDARIEFLPDDDQLAERTARGVGFTRPELAVLLAYAKMALYDQLLASDLPDDEHLAGELPRYFPAALRERFPERIQRHRLRREIVATMLTNEVLNRAGLAFVHEVAERTGCSPADIARAYVISRTILDAPALWAAIEALDNGVPATVQCMLVTECGRLVEECTVWFLRHAARPLQIAREVGTFSSAVQELLQLLDGLLVDEQRQVLKTRAAAFAEKGAPDELALRVARLRYVVPACEIVRLSADEGLPVADVARTYWAVGARFELHWLRRAASALPSDSSWDKLALTSLREDLDAHHVAITRSVLRGPGAGTTPDQAIDAWAATRGAQVQRTQQLLAELRSLPSVDLAMLAVAGRQLAVTAR